MVIVSRTLSGANAPSSEGQCQNCLRTKRSGFSPAAAVFEITSGTMFGGGCHRRFTLAVSMGRSFEPAVMKPDLLDNATPRLCRQYADVRLDRIPVHSRIRSRRFAKGKQRSRHCYAGEQVERWPKPRHGDEFIQEMLRYADPGRFQFRRAAAEEHMKDWCSRTMGDEDQVLASSRAVGEALLSTKNTTDTLITIYVICRVHTDFK